MKSEELILEEDSEIKAEDIEVAISAADYLA